MGKRYNLSWYILEMENKKSSETLQSGFTGSKLVQTENPCSKFLEEAESNFFCNSSGKSAIDVNSGQCQLSHVDNGSVEESLNCYSGTGNNQMNKGFLDMNPEPDLYIKGSKSRNDGVPVVESDLKFSGYDEIPVEEFVNKDNDVLDCREPDSPVKEETSRNGIDIFVEVFGPLDGMYDSDNNFNNSDENPLGETALDQENEEGEADGGQKCTFDVGDLAWVKTRTLLWWPGMVCDNGKATEDEKKAVKKGSFLVKYFGYGNVVWSSGLDLKPFIEHFEEMSRQSNSKSFYGSVERALCEVGRRVKSKMTCTCFSNESLKLATENEEDYSYSRNGISEFYNSSLSQFEPSRFYACIRNLACSVSVPGKIELTVTMNRLSAFYRSIGHREMPLQLLRDAGRDGLKPEVAGEGRNGNLTISRRKKRKVRDDADMIPDDKTSSGKGSESRTRKKSKYLSFPYVNVKKGPDSGQETEDLKHVPSPSSKSTPSGTKSRKKGSRKPVKGHHVISKADDIDSCSSELLSELRSSALDCFHLRRSKYSDSLKRFYCSFRVFTFLDPKIADKHAGGNKSSNDEKCLLGGKGQMGNLATSKVSEEQMKEGVSNAVSTKPSERGIKRRRVRKKKEEVISTVLEHARVQPSSNDEKCLLQNHLEAEGQKGNLVASKASEEQIKQSVDNQDAKGHVIKRRRARKKKEKVILTFLDPKTADKQAGVQQSSNDEKCLLQNSLEAEGQKGNLITPKVSEEQIKETVNNQDAKGPVIKRRRARKKKEVILTFLDPKITDKQAGVQQSSNDEKCLLQNSLEAEGQKGNLVMPKVSEEQIKQSVNNQDAKGPVIKRRRSRKKKEVILTFLDPKIADKQAGVQQSSNDEKCLLQNSLEAEGQKGNLVTPKVSEEQIKESVNNQDAKGPVIKKEEGKSTVLEPTSNSFGMASHVKSFVINFQQNCPETPAIPKLPQTETVAKPDSNGFSFEHMPVTGISLHQVVEPLPKSTEGFVPPVINGVEQMKAFTHVPSLKNALHNAPELNNGFGVNVSGQLYRPEFTSSESTSNTGPGPSVQNSLQMGAILSFSGQPQPRKTPQTASSTIPDLNGNAVTSPGGNHVPPEGNPQIKRRRRNKGPDTESGPDPKMSRVFMNNKQDPGGSLLLSFAQEFPLPSKETLVTTFSRFGLLKESEIQVLDEFTTQIVYERSSDALFAFRSLEKSNPFGASLASFKLIGVQAAPASVKKKNKLKGPNQNPVLPVDACKNPVKPGEAPDLGKLRQNMEMMKNMLEKAGDNLSPEMRAKLENEIKGFLDKIGSSS